MKISEVKTISKLVDKKLLKASEKEKKAKELEEKELNEFNAKEYAENPQTETLNDHAESTDKTLLFVGVGVAILGGVLFLKNKGA